MQREIKKKTITYGIAAIMLVVVLTATIYNFGQLNPTQPFFSELKTFSSYEELENFLTTNTEKANQNQQVFQTDALLGRQDEALAAPETPKATIEGTVSDYSETNIQVAGVDEADVVKTDGEYLYVVSESAIYILKAFPADQATVLSKIELNEAYGSQIYVNGNKLVVVIDHPVFLFAEPAIADAMIEDEAMVDDLIVPPYVYNPEITVKVYDISNKASPALSRTVTVNGTLSGSRMIGNYIYTVVNQQAIKANSEGTGVEVDLPAISGTHTKEVEPTEIYYIDVIDQFYYMTTVVAVDITNDATEPTIETFLTSQTSSMYVSENNMYLIAPNTNNWLLKDSEEEAEDETLMYRVKLDEQNMVVEAEGSVTGFVLNQFSMDEHNGYFRIATTEWDNRWTDEGFISNSTNSLFIMDMNLNVVGKLENLAFGESIYSTRFMGDRVYIVTFRQIDPFFVIDTSNPTQPTVLGYLKIPGYSSYLHPYDENHIIGIGMENSTLKLSLFDVTDVTSPEEISKYIVEADYSSSTAIWDHKAFLFDKTKNLLALPVSTNFYTDIIEPRTEPAAETKNQTVDPDDEQTSEPPRDAENNDTVTEREVVSFSNDYWQGAYIFDVSVENGFTLRGTITHKTAADQYEYRLEVKRILYIEDVIYTISDKTVKLNNLESLELLNEIQLS